MFDNEIIEAKDTILQTVAQCTASRPDDKNFDVYLWSQMADDLKRSKMLRIDKRTGKHEEDSDVDAEEEELIESEKILDLFDLTKGKKME